MRVSPTRPPYPPDSGPPRTGDSSTIRIKTLELGRTRPEIAVKPVEKAEAPDGEELRSREELKEVLEKTLELAELMSPRRHLKYEVIEEADIVQVQVINSNDNTVVRKIPADEIVDLVKQIRQMLSDRFEVEA